VLQVLVPQVLRGQNLPELVAVVSVRVLERPGPRKALPPLLRRQLQVPEVQLVF
jgi:hypothetical protein